MIPDQTFTLVRAKAHLRVPHTQEDELITAMMDAAVAACERYTRRAWTARTWSVMVDACDLCGCSDPAVFHPALSPATAAVYSLDPGTGDPAQIPDTNVVMSTQFGASVLTVNWSLPYPAKGNAGRIDYTAAPSGDVPPDVYAAAMLYLGDLYENREAQVTAMAVQPNAMADLLLRSYVVDLHA